MGRPLLPILGSIFSNQRCEFQAIRFLLFDIIITLVKVGDPTLRVNLFCQSHRFLASAKDMMFRGILQVVENRKRPADHDAHGQIDQYYRFKSTVDKTRSMRGY